MHATVTVTNDKRPRRGPLDALSRQDQEILFRLAFLVACDFQSSTYLGLRRLLGINMKSTRRAVRQAEASGLVIVTHCPDGRGRKARVYLSPLAAELLRTAARSAVAGFLKESVNE